ncbi:MAG: hypothetical protein JRN07_03350 [Nitrososphaerota archaeon]|nr:hypothetical protein [Nitrososphaerota archaeon]
MKRARWGPLLLLALAASPLLALVLLAVVVILFRPFRKKEYGHPAMTLQGEAVRSGAEKRVADWLFLRGIRYEYERPAFDRSGRVISRPDFYLPDLGVYVEYWGLVGKSKGYEDSMMR